MIIEKILGKAFLTKLKNQSFSVILLIIGLSIAFYEIKGLKEDYRTCHNQQIEILLSVVQNNTVALEKVDDKLSCK